MKTFILTALLTGLGTLLFGQAPTLVFSPTTIPDAVYGTDYPDQMLTVDGGVAPYSFSVSAGALPPGMNLGPDGKINGKPTAAGSFSFTVTVTDNSPSPGPYTGTQDYTLVVDQVVLTIKANNAMMPYGGNFPMLNLNYSGFVNGDNVNDLTTPATPMTVPATSPVGSYAITPAGATSPNYTFTYVDGTLTINPVPLMIDANDGSMTYGGTVPVLTATYNGFVNGDDASSLTKPPDLTTTASSTSNAGNYPITASNAIDANYNITYRSGMMNVGKAPLTVTADDKSMPLGGPLPALTVSYTGFVNGDDASALGGQPMAHTTANDHSPAGTYPITVAGGGSPNYTFTFVSGTLTVGTAVLTSTASPATSVYGSPLVPNGSLTVTYSGFVNGDGPGSMTTLPTVANSAVAGSPAGTYVLTPSGAVNPNYTIQYVTGVYTISPAPLNVTAANKSMTYGGTVPPLTVSYTGFVNGDGVASLSSPGTATTTANSSSPAGTYPITASGTVDANYTITYTVGTLTIGKAPLTVTADNKSMPLGGPLPPLTVSYSGFVNGDNASSLTTPSMASTAAMANSPAGTYPITASGGSSPNYTFTYFSGTLSVATAVLTITANPAGSVYGSLLVPNGSLTVTYSGFVNGDGPGSLTTPPTVANTAVAGSPAGAYTLTPSGAVSSNYSIQYVTGTYTISPAPLNVAAANKNMTYGGAVPPLTLSYTGFVNGDGVSSLTSPGAATTTANSSSPAGAYAITASGTVDPNYTITYTAGTLTIGKAPLTVTADSKSMPLGGPLPPLTVSYSGFVNGDDASDLTTPSVASTSALATSPAGTYPITASGGSSPNYTFTYVNGTLAVATAVLTIRANPAGSVYGSPLVPNGSLTVTYTGFVNGDGPGSLTTLPTVANTAVAGSPAGTYTLTPSGAVSANYSIQYATGTYTISPAPLNVTAANNSITYGGTVPPLTVSYTGFVNGDGVSSLSSPATATTSANSSSPAGAYPITASGAAGSNYTITYTAGTLTVGKAPLTVTADSKSMPLGGPLPPLTVSYSGFVNGDNASSLTTPSMASTAATAASPAGTYAITASGGSSPNYTFTYVNGTLAVATAVLTITANPAGSVYGSSLVSNGSLTVSYSGFVNGDGPGSLTTLPAVTNSAFAGAPAGTYTLTPSGAVSSNYTIQYVTGTYTISSAPLTITVANNSMNYGGAVPPLSLSYSGFVNGDNASSLTTAPTLSTTATTSSPAGTYPITASGAVDPNYNITYQPGTMTVGKVPLTVTADNRAMPLGGPLPLLTVSYTGFVNGDNASNLTTQPTITTIATANSPAGTYPITTSGAASPNYTFSYVNGTLTVATAVLTITAGPASTIYGSPLVPNASLPIIYSGFVNGDGPNSLAVRPTVTNMAYPGAPAGTYTLVPSGAVDPNYAIQYYNGEYTIRPAILNVIPANKSMTYGGTLPPFTVSYSGFVNGDNSSSLTTPPVLSTTATSASPAGTYFITASGAIDPNYSFVYNGGLLTINPAALQVTAKPQTKEFGSSDPALTYTASGLVNGDGPGAFSGSLTRAPGESVGTYPILQGTLSAGASYFINYTASTFTITSASQTIAWDQSLLVGCPDTTPVTLTATASSGLPVTYSVSDPNVATISGNILTLVHPGTAIVTAHQAGDSNRAAAAPVTDTVVYKSGSLIAQHWSDAIFFDNSSGDYVKWQWYKNGDAVAGATDPYYNETPSLNGKYYVIATNKNDKDVQSCILTITGGAAIPGGIKVSPNPASAGAQVTVTCNYPAAALDGATLQVLDLTGRIRQQLTNVQPTMQVTMPSDTGIYVVKLILTSGQRASTNVLVVY